MKKSGIESKESRKKESNLWLKDFKNWLFGKIWKIKTFVLVVIIASLAGGYLINTSAWAAPLISTQHEGPLPLHGMERSLNPMDPGSANPWETMLEMDDALQGMFDAQNNEQMQKQLNVLKAKIRQLEISLDQ